MNPFDANTLTGPIMAIFFITLLISFSFTKSTVIAVSAAFIKAGLYAIYFGLLFDGTYTFFDDWRYLEGGRNLLDHDIGLANLSEHWEIALMIGGGDHFAYYLYNAYAFRLFGEGYHAPVALNVILTTGIAYFGASLARLEFKVSKINARLFFLFLLFHPDILAWSNIMNGKDILVLLLHILLLTSVSEYLRGQVLFAIKIAIPVIFILLFLRFYVPLLFTIAFVASILLSKNYNNIGYVLFSTLLLLLAIFWIGEINLLNAVDNLKDNLVNPIYGFIRFILTPIPFNSENSYAFLNFAALAHWLLIPFVFYGLACIWSFKTPFSAFFIGYILVFLTLYAVYGELQGPRHRVQMDYAFALLQFIGVTAVLSRTRSNSLFQRKPAPPF